MLKHSFNKRNEISLRDRLDYLKNKVDLEYLLSTLGFSNIRDSHKELRCPCAIHGGNNKTGFRLNKNTRTWSCFTHKCDDKYGKDLIGLISAKNNCSFMEAIRFLEELTGESGDYSKKAIEFRRDKKDDMFVKAYLNYSKKPDYVSEDNLKKFKPFRSKRFLKDGFLSSTLNYFEVAGGFTDKYKNIRDIIPIRSTDGVLEAYSMRDIRDNMSDEEKDYKYILSPGFDKDKVLYNLHNAKHYCVDKPLIVVEGFKSVWKLHELGVHNVVCIMGSLVTSGQLSLLCSYALKGVVLMLDGDPPGVKGTLSSLKLLSAYLPVVPIFITEEGKDPSDLDDDVLKSYLQEYI